MHDTSAGRRFLVTQFVEYSIFDYITKTSKETREDYFDVAKKVALQMLESIQELHEKSVYVHRDVKPENFRVDSNGKVYLIDFGIAGAYLDD